MAWSIPDKGEGANDIQSVLFQEYLDVIVAGLSGADCVLSGCAVSAQGSPDMTVAVAKGAVLSNGTLFAVAAGNATITTADGSNPRLDLIVVNSSGTVAVRTGTAAASPKPAAKSANDVVLAVVYVPAADTTIASNQITDLRVMRTQGPIVLKKSTSVTRNTDSAAYTYFTCTIPNGLFLAGRQLRVKMGGNYLANSGTPTWTLTISYGGTTMFADATGATTADADRGSWDLEFVVSAESNSAQRLSGRATFQTPGAKTAPTTGTSGDLAATSSVNMAYRGTAAVDSDAGNRDLVVQWTMNVSNAADETVMDYASLELL